MFDMEGIARGFSGMVAGGWWDAMHIVETAATYDSGGSIVAAGTASEVECLAQVDVATQAMRLDADFQETDVRLLVMGVTYLNIGERVEMAAGPNNGTVYVLRSAVRDPAGVGWECRGRAA